MNKEQLEKIGSTFIGCMLMDAKFRKNVAKAHEEGDHEEIARLINSKMRPRPALKAADVHKLRKHMQSKLENVKSTAPTFYVSGQGLIGVHYSEENR